jgi:hypothetical protein
MGYNMGVVSQNYEMHAEATTSRLAPRILHTFVRSCTTSAPAETVCCDMPSPASSTNVASFRLDFRVPNYFLEPTNTTSRLGSLDLFRDPDVPQ